MHDKAAEHADHLLHRHVRVIEEGAVLAQRELIDEAFAGHHGLLPDAGDAVHLYGKLDAVPVYARRLGEMILEDDADLVAFVGLDGGTWRASVEPPEIERAAGDYRLLHGLSGEVEDFDAVVECEGQVGDVRRDDWQRLRLRPRDAGDRGCACGES